MYEPASPPRGIAHQRQANLEFRINCILFRERNYHVISFNRYGYLHYRDK